VPEQRLLVETDSPYLAPAPFRGRRCEPAYVAHTQELLARLREVSPAELASATAVNTRRLFRL
jgi:TatD DNase family protein